MADEDTECAELHHFISGLRKLREQAGQPSLRAMARTAHYSHTALSGVLSSDRLPSLALVLAFVRACHGDEGEWRRRWYQAKRSIEAVARDTTAVPPRDGRGRRWLIVIGSAAMAAAFVAVGIVIIMDTGAATVRPRSLAQAPAVSADSCPARYDPADRPLMPCDDDRFVADVTIPDGTTVRAGQRFVKTWEIQNTGLVAWQGRYLSRQGLLTGPGLCSSLPRVPIPTTLPGRDVRISVTLTAPSLPGSCRVDWKMTDHNGRLYFPDRSGLYVIVNVTG